MIVRRALVAVGALAVLGVLAACGVAPEPSANRIEPADVPFGLLEANPTTTEVAQGRAVEVYLIADEQLISVPRRVPDDAELAELVELVVDGPTDAERSLGITSALPTGTVESVGVGGGVAQVDLSSAFGEVRPADQLFALAQIVYTVTGEPGIGGVDFTLDGAPIDLPLDDGTRTTGPLSRDDVAPLAPG